MAEFTLVIGNKNYSSWSLRAWLALKQADIEFNELRILLDQPDTRNRLLQQSPSGKVPVLRHGSLVIWESIAICEYIAEQRPDRHLLPTNRTARAIARAVSAEMHAGFAPLRQHMPMDCRARRPGQGLKPGVSENIERITTIWRDCRHQFGNTGDFLFGQFTIADAMYAPVVSRFITYGVQLDECSQAYVEAMVALPAMQEWLLAAAAETEHIAESKL
ncbi:glutathione S-transferase family protein [Oculatella sp. LEGE 06141]|uniref:glutathione S-transferase family protein n=1 Tax=Oculatella sp. LEGE 06141 TaxID=1828648 RepID=UPI001882AC3B|nr:glutathione S-transferase family protein [Oculatella sp. LEGE 06141]MBE9177580.1 glutathione S-transferase family protein [Oculatella sp. LEGE 06141]